MHSLQKTILFITLCAAPLWVGVDAFAQSDPRRVRVGIYQNAPQVFLDETGTPKGIYVDILDEVARLEGWKLDYVSGSFAEHLEAVKDGRIDMLTSIAATPERQKNIYFSRKTVVAVWGQLYLAPKLTAQNILELDGQKISVMNDGVMGLKPEETFTTPTWLKWLLVVISIFIALSFFWNMALHKEMKRRKNVETALRQCDDLYFQILENMSNGVAIYEAINDGQDFVFKDLNAAGERIENLNKSEIVGKRLTEAFPSAEKFGILDAMRRVWASGKPEHFPISMYADNRISGWRDNYIFRLPTGEVVAVYDDVTARKQTEENLRSSEKKFHSIVQTTTEGFWLIDPRTKETLEVNSALCKMLGYTEPEILGKTPFDFVDDENAAILKEQTAKIAQTDNRAYSITLKHKDGHDIFTHFEASTIFYDDGTPHVVFAFIKDITQSVLFQNELRQAKEDAEHANQAKTAFLASMNHELRTPLNSIIGFADMMHYEVKGPLSEDYKEYTSLITRSGRLLLETINSVLDVAKIEAGKFELFIEPTNTDTIVNEVLTILSIQAQAKGLSVHNTILNMHNLLVDPLRIKQVLLNIIGNAIKFTDEGTITIYNHCDESGHNIIIEDTGIGMTEDQVKIALQPFQQVHGSALARRYQGTGLGLSYSQKIMELHGGTLTVTSSPDIGTIVTLHFPPEAAAKRVAL